MAKKYTRKEFLKYSGKIGLGAAVYGFLGNFAGRGYKGMKDFYEENIEPAVEAKKNIENKADSLKNKFYDFIGKEREFEKKEDKPEEKISKRGFFKRYFNAFHEHSVGVGTSTGVVVGGTKSALTNYGKYKTEGKINEGQRKIKSLEEKNKELEEKYSKLEELISGKNKNIFLFLGMVGLAFILMNSAFNITGNVVGNGLVDFSGINFLILAISLIFIFISVRRRY